MNKTEFKRKVRYINLSKLEAVNKNMASAIQDLIKKVNDPNSGDFDYETSEILDAFFSKVEKDHKDLFPEKKKITRPKTKKFKIGDFVANKKHKTIGEVIDVFETGNDLRTDADGVVPLSDLEKFDEEKHKHFHITIPSTREKLRAKYPRPKIEKIHYYPYSVGYKSTLCGIKWDKIKDHTSNVKDVTCMRCLDEIDSKSDLQKVKDAKSKKTQQDYKKEGIRLIKEARELRKKAKTGDKDASKKLIANVKARRAWRKKEYDCGGNFEKGGKLDITDEEVYRIWKAVYGGNYPSDTKARKDILKFMKEENVSLKEIKEYVSEQDNYKLGGVFKKKNKELGEYIESQIKKGTPRYDIIENVMSKYKLSKNSASYYVDRAMKDNIKKHTKGGEIKESTVNDFKKELKNLLKKYNATINLTMEGDTHGITDDKIEIRINDKVILDSGMDWEFTHYDIK